MTISRTCHYCGPTDDELRPYGPGGSTVCFPCATAAPEREQAAQGAFGALLEATSVLGLTAIGTEAGPINVDAEDLAHLHQTRQPAPARPARSTKFQSAIAGRPLDLVSFRAGSGRQYEGERSDSCPGDGHSGHRHDISCIRPPSPPKPPAGRPQTFA